MSVNFIVCVEAPAEKHGCPCLWKGKLRYRTGDISQVDVKRKS